jgi:hypothetical protein
LSKSILVIPIAFTISIILSIAIVQQQAYALQQVAGHIVVDISPGETKTFGWGILSDSNQSSTTITTNVNISANGNGSQFLSFPKSVKLPPSGEIVYVPVNVSVPANYKTNSVQELNPTIRATEAGQKFGPTAINIEMSKILSIVIGGNEKPFLRGPTNVMIPGPS